MTRTEAQGRLLSLEGLRAVAALIVVLVHATSIFYPAIFYGINSSYATMHNSRFEEWLHGNPLGVFLSGTFAVQIFFVLSGFVLTVSYFTTGKREVLQKMAAKRYLRLMLPALGSILLAWLLLASNLSHQRVAVSLITHSVWLEKLWNFHPHLLDAVAQGIWGVFAVNAKSYNPVLWTIYYEFIGSFIVLMTAMFFGRLRLRYVVYAFLCVLFMESYLLGFVLGMILADLYSRKLFPFNDIKSGAWLVLGIGLFMGGFPLKAAGQFYHAMSIPAFGSAISQVFFTCIGAALVMICVLASPVLSRIFSHRILSGLGKYTYSIYLVHLPIFLSVCPTIFLSIHSTMNYHLAALVSVVATLFVIALVTVLFEKYVDGPSIRLSSLFARWITKEQIDKGIKPETDQDQNYARVLADGKSPAIKDSAI